MSVAARVGKFLKDLFGFRKNSSYVKSYLNDANIRSGIYMAGIVIILEIYMIIRQTTEYIIKYWDKYVPTKYDNHFLMTYNMLAFYFLFLVAAIALLLFSLLYTNKKHGKKTFITNMTLGSICALWIFLIFLHKFSDWEKYSIDNVLTILLYVFMSMFGGFIILDALYVKKNGKNNVILSNAIITMFAAICLLFGIKVGYSDFANVPKVVDGVVNIDKIKMITCFLTMVIFVGCLLIWKPYISIIILTTIFVSFHILLESYDGRDFVDGDTINYYTFLLTLTMVAVSVYQQRITEAKKDEKLIHDAIYDHLVELHNINYISNEIIKLQKKHPEKIENHIYLFVNLANFRTINDQKGFGEGDRTLKTIANSIQKEFSNDLVARQSDDHFVIFTENNNLDDKIEKLDKIVKDAVLGLFVLVKIGGYKPNKDENPNRAIDKARYACGIIKRKSDIKYLEYNSEMDEKHNKRQYIVNHLDEAIEQGWIRAFYQPVVWSETRELCGAEALARWIDPTYGFLSPADFIPVLEETRLIHKLDRCIIDCVCKDIRDNLDRKNQIVPISINFSRLDFELMDVIKELEDITSKYNVGKEYLHVEITESALSNNVDFLNEKIKILKELGYAVWLDDFGSGYSSLNVLKDFNFDVIKIDMKFLSNFDSNEKTKDILDCIIQLANRLGMKSLTEGVETDNEADFLKKIGCGRLQGYRFSKPLKKEDFEKFISDNKVRI